MSLKTEARKVKSAGRRGDSILVHMRPNELMALAAFLGGQITTNPDTGLPEAFSLGGAFNNITSAIDRAVPQVLPDNAFGFAVSPLLSGNFTATQGFAAKPGSWIEGKYQSTGLDQMVPALNMFGKAIGGAALGSWLGGGAGAGGETGTTSSGTTFGQYDDPSLVGGGGNTLMPAAQADPYATAGGGSAATPTASAMPAAMADPMATSGGGSAAVPNAGVGLTGEGLPPGSPVASPEFSINPETFGDSGFTAPGGGSPSINYDYGGGSPFGTGGSADFSANAMDSSWWQRWKDFIPKQNAKNIGGELGLASSAYGLYAASQARRAAANAYNQSRDPNTEAYQRQLAQLMADPNSVTNTPGYQFGMDQGRLAIQRQGAATGSGGNEAIALAKFSPAYAQQVYQQQVQNLINASRSGVGDPRVVMQANMNYQNAISQALRAAGYGIQMMG